jgi:hypothetical protein
MRREIPTLYQSLEHFPVSPTTLGSPTIKAIPTNFKAGDYEARPIRPITFSEWMVRTGSTFQNRSKNLRKYNLMPKAPRYYLLGSLNADSSPSSETSKPPIVLPVHKVEPNLAYNLTFWDRSNNLRKYNLITD